MRTHLHRWLPTAIALLALVVALGGPAAARNLIDGKHIKKGTVASKQLKDGSITAVDVAANGLTGAQVADGTLSGGDLADGTVSSADIADGGLTGTDVKDGSVATPDLADGAVTGTKLANGSVGRTKLQADSVTGAALEAAGTVFLNFGLLPAHTCSLGLLASFSTAQLPDPLGDDVVTATPDAFFGGYVSFSVKTEGAYSIYVKLCNVGDTDVNPDGTGGTWRYVAIDLG